MNLKSFFPYRGKKLRREENSKEKMSRTVFGIDKPPMLPLIASEPKFVACSEVEAQQFAANRALVGNLTDALKCWLSHIADTLVERDAVLSRWNESNLLNPREIVHELKALEVSLSFFQHIQSEGVIACRRVLKYVPEVQASLQDLHKSMHTLQQLHLEVSDDLSHLTLCGTYFLDSGMQPDTWAVRDLGDTMPPLFSSIRVICLCSKQFGALQPDRFLAMIRYLINRVQRSVHDATFDCVRRVVDAGHKSISKVKRDLVDAQEGCVAVQEEFFAMRRKIAECEDSGSAHHAALEGVDDRDLFNVAEWQYERIIALLASLDAMKEGVEKIGSALTDPLSMDTVDLMDPDSISQERFVKFVHRLIHEPAPNPLSIIERMGKKGVRGAPPVARQHAPRVPFNKLSNTLCLYVLFKPEPVVTILGGPLSDASLDALSNALPLCCAQTVVESNLRKVHTPVFYSLLSGGRRMEIHDQYCETDIHVSKFLLTIVDVIETEDAWEMIDALANVEIEMEKDCEYHQLLFRKHRSSQKISERSPR